MKVVVEANIPFIRGSLEGMAEVVYLPAGEICRETLKDADALITRTRTRCDAQLLEGTRCRFIATATIGTDHIDMPWCRANGITVANAPGCNAPAVAQYVLTSIARVMQLRGTLEIPAGLKLGIVGAGHVGSIVDRWARHLGFDTLLCDPPRERCGDPGPWTDHDTILREADIITYHTPLTTSGPDATRHLLDTRALACLRQKPVIINAARGPVADNAALAEALLRGQAGAAVIDCWEGEPHVNPLLLDLASVATPHIAGYSREGKIRATRMALDAFTSWAGLPQAPMAGPVPGPVPEGVTWDALLASYSPERDTSAFKAAPGQMEALRNNYIYRPEPL